MNFQCLENESSDLGRLRRRQHRYMLVLAMASPASHHQKTNNVYSLLRRAAMPTLVSFPFPFRHQAATQHDGGPPHCPQSQTKHKVFKRIFSSKNVERDQAPLRVNFTKLSATVRGCPKRPSTGNGTPVFLYLCFRHPVKQDYSLAHGHIITRSWDNP